MVPSLPPDADALNAWVERCYGELRPLARRQMRNERPGHTLDTTSLIHEAYARLAGGEVTPVDEQHFMRVAARAMRRVLVDHARSHNADKRGGGLTPLPLLEELTRTPADPTGPTQLLAVDQALTDLEKLDARLAEMVQLHYFGGFDQVKTAELLGVSLATVERGLRFARAWFKDRMKT